MYRADVEVALGLYRLNEVIYPPTSSPCSRVVVCRGCYTRHSSRHLQHMCRGATHDGSCPHIWSIILGLEVKQSTVGVVSLIMLLHVSVQFAGFFFSPLLSVFVTVRSFVVISCTILWHILTKNTKMKIYKTMIRPVVTYSSETWTMTAKDENKLRIFERQILRKILGPVNINNIWRIRNNMEIDKLIDGADVVRFIKA